MKGREWGCYGGRPINESQMGSASTFAQQGLGRPMRWEPQVGYQLHAVIYLREALRTKRLGQFTKKDNDKEEWEEPDEDDVSDQVWSEIRDAGFGGRNVNKRDLTRIWSRRANLAEQVELLELGKAG